MLSRPLSIPRSFRRPRAAPLFAPLTAPGFRLKCLTCGDERALPPGPPLPTARRSPHPLPTNPTRGGEGRLLPASPHTTVVNNQHGTAALAASPSATLARTHLCAARRRPSLSHQQPPCRLPRQRARHGQQQRRLRHSAKKDDKGAASKAAAAAQRATARPRATAPSSRTDAQDLRGA